MICDTCGHNEATLIEGLQCPETGYVETIALCDACQEPAEVRNLAASLVAIPEAFAFTVYDDCPF